MKKFRKVLDGLTTSSPASTGGSPSCGSAAGTPTAAPTPREIDIPETLMSENFQICKTVRHGFPYQPTAVAFDPVQKILAIGSRSGGVRILGQPGVDSFCQHESGAAVLQLQFLINEGALVTACSDDTLHLWNLRQRRPAILHSLKFNRERITFCHLPFQSKWLYVGTERGNTHIVNIESFVLSGYVIMWNKAIELATKTHPGPVVHLSDSPKDEGRLLIGFESGTIVMWDLKAKKADFRIYYDEAIHSVSWHHEGRQFMCSHSDGSLSMWNLRNTAKPFQVTFPHGKTQRDVRKESCKPILKVEYKTLTLQMLYKLKSSKVFEKPLTLQMLYKLKSSKVFEKPLTLQMLYKLKSSKVFEKPLTLQMLYKLKSSKVFEKPRVCGAEGSRAADLAEEDPYAVQMVNWCPQSRLLCVVGISANLILFRLSRHEANANITALEVRLHCDMDEVISPSDTENNPCLSETSGHSPQPPGSPRPPTPDGSRDTMACLKVKERVVRMPAGYQAELVVQLQWVDGEPPQPITSVDINSAYGLLAVGNCNGLAVVDYLQKTVLLCMSTLDLYGPADPFQRLTRSPRKNRQSTSEHGLRGLSNFYSDSKKRIRTSYQSLTELSDNQVSLDMERSKSPTSDHVNGHCPSPASSQQAVVGGRGRVTGGPAGEGIRLARRGPGRPPFRKAQSAACMEISLPVATHTEESRENSFSRSRSSSVSSIDRDTKEAVSALQFGESYGRKGDALPTPCLWVGTSLGLVLLMPISIPTDDQERLEDPVTVAPTGTVLMLKGSVLRFAFLDCGGAVMQTPYEVWRDPNASDDPERPRRRRLVNFSPGSSQEASAEGQLAVVCSERQAKVFLMPSQACLYVHNITEASFVIRADVVSLNTSICLACFLANGHVMTLSLPSLRPLLDVNYLPLTDMRIARTFCFTHGGQALYLNSPTEIQRITYSQDMCHNLQEMLGELFIPIETPEAQNRGFLKGFFGGNAQTFDREELFGEAAAGKASGSLAKHIPGQAGMEGMKVAAGGVVGELARARVALDERGQRLGELEDRTALMMTSAECFSKNAHALMLRCKDKKWYQW
ncbi:syntaxin-binding protein 5-like [Sardina pilchardus]|uniref:syntaxin-binding protein 5-like n=1 Tax=Sardina pilchardus TaxID=27697 RepID=UPI002E133CB0